VTENLGNGFDWCPVVVQPRAVVPNFVPTSIPEQLRLGAMCSAVSLSMLVGCRNWWQFVAIAVSALFSMRV
jgi:hypothetical protein